MEVSKLLDTYRLRGPNFKDWLRNLRIVLCLEKIEYVLDNPPPPPPPPVKEVQDKIALDKWRDDNYRAWFYMLSSMTNVLQKQHVNTECAYEVLMHLQEMYAHLCVKRLSISKKLFSMRLSLDSSFSEHVLNMVIYIKQLEEFGASMSKDLAFDLILQSLPESFSEFITDCNLNKGDYDLDGFVNMLISAEAKMKKANGCRKSCFSKTEIKHSKAKIKKTKSKVGIKKEKALLKPKGGIQKAHLKVKGGVKKPSGGTAQSQLNSVGSIRKCFLSCGKEGHLEKDCRVDITPAKSSIENSEPVEIDCQGKCFHSDKEEQVEKDCRVDITPAKSSTNKSELGKVNCRVKCFRCGKKGGHIAKDCRADILPPTTSCVQENPNDWHKWIKPEYGWIKLNTDGCRKGFGGIFRDHEGKPLYAYINRSLTDDIFVVEIRAVLSGIYLAWQTGIRVLWVESDCLCAVKAISGEQACPPKSAVYLNQILQLIGLFQKFRISHSWRECNQAADHLSKMDFRVNDALVDTAVLSPNDFPESLWSIIKEDAGGRLYYRQTSSSSRSTCQTAPTPHVLLFQPPLSS